MRSVWLLALLILCGLSAGWILVQDRPGGMEAALNSALASVDPNPAAGSTGTGPEGAQAPSGAAGEPTFYRFTDASGSVRFVTSLADVPPELRSQAKAITQNRVQRAETPSAAPAPARRPRLATRPAAPTQPAFARNRDVIVYTTSWCGWCRKTLAFLDENGVVYENRDIEKDDLWRQELREKTGATSIPVVEIDGQIIRGFDPKRMRRLLQAS